MSSIPLDAPYTLVGGTVIDGTGAASYSANVVVEGDRIVAVGAETNRRGVTIDCTGLAVSPGFIDMHSHSDLVCMSDPQLAAKLRQGITTEVLGQDGLSEAPVPPEYVPMWRRHLSGLNGDPDLPWDWGSFGDYLERCGGAAINRQQSAEVSCHPAIILKTICISSPGGNRYNKCICLKEAGQVRIGF